MMPTEQADRGARVYSAAGLGRELRTSNFLLALMAAAAETGRINVDTGERITWRQEAAELRGEFLAMKRRAIAAEALLTPPAPHSDEAILALSQQDQVGLTTPAVLGGDDIDGLKSQSCADGSLPVLKELPHSGGKPWDLYGPLGDLTASLEALISESDGVYGLHKNGDPAPWEELLTGGQFEDWLRALSDARKALDAETAYRGQPPGALWIGDDDAADAARYRHLKEHHSYHYAEGYNPPTPREFGIQWEHQDSTPARPCMDWLIDQDIAAKAAADEECRAEAWDYIPATPNLSGPQGTEAALSATDEPFSPPPPAGGVK